MKYWIFIFTLLGLFSCSHNDSPSSNLKVVEIAARDDGTDRERPLIYRVKMPTSWVLQIPAAHESLTDTTKAIAEFFIIDGEQKIRIAIHNFPTNSLSQRIPPMAQLSRWKKQFQSLDLASLSILPQAFGGFSGLLLEANGLINNAKTSIMGWSLQLAPEHYQSLSRPAPSALEKKHRQMRGDITIKAVGPLELMKHYHDDINSFARSFQFIEDIP